MKQILNYTAQIITLVFAMTFNVANADWIDSNGLQWKPANSSAAPNASYRLATFNEVAELVSEITDNASALTFFKRTKAATLRAGFGFTTFDLHYAVFIDASGNSWKIRDALTCQPWPNNNVCATQFVTVFDSSSNLEGLPLYVKSATTDQLKIKSPLSGNVNSLVTIDIDSISTQPATVLMQFSGGPWVVFCSRVPCSFSTIGALPGQRNIRVEQSEDAPRLGEIMDDEVEVVFTN